MATVLGFISFLLFIAFIVGLVKPQLVLKWTNKPTRLKVFGYWILASSLVGVLSVVTETDEDRAKSDIAAAQAYIESEDFEGAISKLEEVKSDNPHYVEAQELLQKADSLNKSSKEQLQLVKETETKKLAEEENLKQREQLIRELKSVNDGVDFTTYRGSLESLQMELILFGTWAKIITDGENSEDGEIRRLAKQLKPKVISMQVKEFPILRKEYTKVVASIMWENDIEVSSNGTGNNKINFTGGLFAANKNKKDFQAQVHEVLTMFRFKQARYRWYKDADDYTYWDVYKGKDSELVVFND